MAHVTMSGLPEELGTWLEKRFPGLDVSSVPPQSLLDSATTASAALVIIDDSITEPPPADILQALPRTADGSRRPVVFCCNQLDASSRELVELGVAHFLLHPLDREELIIHIADTLNVEVPQAPRTDDEKQRGFRAAMQQLWEASKENILARVAVVEHAAMLALEGPLAADTARQAEHEAHKLAGLVGSFGFTEGSRLSRELERMLANPGSIGRNQALHLSELVVSLRWELDGEPTWLPVRAMASAAAPLGHEHPLILIVDPDTQLADEVADVARERGFRVETSRDLVHARHVVHRERPDVVLLDVASAEGPDETIGFLAELTTRKPSIPVLVFTAQGEFRQRVEMARLGVADFLQKPMPAEEALNMAASVLEQVRAAESKVLVVDDDPHVIEAIKLLLEPRGLRLATCDDPLRFWDKLDEVSPDLLLLDVDMPHISGIELCRVVRLDPRYSRLPVLFLTMRSDTDTIHRVFGAGGDDFISKPIVGPELITRVVNRLERVQLLRTMAETDALTGVANRHKSSQVLSQFLRLAKRQDLPLSVGIVDVDHFKKLNDGFGHAAGDWVLRSLGQLLLRSFRGEDIVARWGGEEFLVGMYGMNRPQGVQRLAQIQDSLQKELFSAPDGTEFKVTFSAGVAEYPLDGEDIQTLVKAADQALHAAKAAGRAQVMPAGSQVVPPARSRKKTPARS